jgi:hypothetical protein
LVDKIIGVIVLAAMRSAIKDMGDPKSLELFLLGGIIMASNVQLIGHLMNPGALLFFNEHGRGLLRDFKSCSFEGAFELEFHLSEFHF